MATPVGDFYACASGGVIAAGRVIVSPFWRDMEPGWHDLTPAGTRPPFGILAFSGSAWDSKGGKMYIQGGGHADYAGNEVWEWDYENRDAAFVKHYEPDFTAIHNGAYTPSEKYALLAPYVDNDNYPGAVMIDGQPVRPISRHTYASVCWMPWLNRMTVGGGSTYSGMTPVDYWTNVWLNSPKDMWHYDPVAKTYEYKGSELLTPAFKTISRFAAHEGRQRLYGVGINVSNRAVIYDQNPAANTWVIHPTAGPSLSATAVSMVVDEVNDRLIVLMKPSASTYLVAYAYDLTAGTWSEITTSGTPPTHLNAEARAIFSSGTNTLLLLRAYGDGIAKLSLTTGAWTTQAISGPNFTQTSGNWFYDRRRQVCLLTYQNLSAGIRVWAYKE